jgi:hypothetical protein
MEAEKHMRCLKRAAIVAAILVVGLGVTPQRASADPFSITFGGSTLSGDTTSAITNWTVAGVDAGTNQLFEEAYYLQLGSGDPAVISPQAFQVLGPNSILIGYNTNGSGVCTTADLSGCEVTVTHTLSGTSAWSSTFGVFNLENYSIYTYSDFDLDGTSGGDTASYLGTGRFVQSDTLASLVWQTNASLASFDVYDCCGLDVVTPLQNRTTFTGDAVFATQASNQDGFSIDRRLSAVPEPMSLLLVGSGMLGVAARRRRKAKKA